MGIVEYISLYVVCVKGFQEGEKKRRRKKRRREKQRGTPQKVCMCACCGVCVCVCNGSRNFVVFFCCFFFCSNVHNDPRQGTRSDRVGSGGLNSSCVFWGVTLTQTVLVEFFWLGVFYYLSPSRAALRCSRLASNAFPLCNCCLSSSLSATFGTAAPTSF